MEDDFVPGEVVEDRVVVGDFADDLGVRKQRIFKILPRLGISTSMRREESRGNQLVATVSAQEASRIRREVETYSSESVGDQAVNGAAIAPSLGDTASAFVATIDDITRFRTAHELEAYLGRIPCERRAGETRQLGHITKAGNGRLRWLLVEAAWTILRSKSPDTAALSEDLVDHRRLCDAGDEAHRAVAGGTGERVDLDELFTLLIVPLFAATATASAQTAPPAPDRPRTIEGVNTVWLEELTQPEFRDMLKDGYTTVLIMTGGVENNDANLRMNKHNLNNRLLGETIARTMGKTLVAPLVTLKHIPEYHNHTTVVPPYLQNELRIPEGIKIGTSRGTSGLHEELGIDATMALVDPQSIRYEQRVKAGEAEINGIKFESLEWLQELGRKIAELRATTTIKAIDAYRETLPDP